MITLFIGDVFVAGIILQIAVHRSLQCSDALSITMLIQHN
jgi:hypothetical protein